MAHKPIIGVTGPVKGGKILWYFTKLSIALVGGRAKRITANTSLDLANYDGFIISGGGDINPQLYGEAALLEGKLYDTDRDALEQKVIHYALDNRKPLLGICRGMQLMNVTLGGSLYQEAKEVLEDFLPNDSMISKIIGRRRITIAPQSQLHMIMEQKESYLVNSIHHQAVNRVGDGLEIVATEANGLIQATEHQDKERHPFCIGVQWHPELMPYIKHARRLFKALIKTTSAA
jgi:putative glutamine amidotransferase